MLPSLAPQTCLQLILWLRLMSISWRGRVKKQEDFDIHPDSPCLTSSVTEFESAQFYEDLQRSSDACSKLESASKTHR